MIKKADIYIVVSLVFTVLLLFAVRMFSFFPKNESVMNIYVDGKLTHSCILPVKKEEVFDIESEYGHNKIIVSEHKCYIAEADCRGHDCIKMGEIESNGQMIICATNRLVVRIEGKGELDAVSY